MTSAAAATRSSARPAVEAERDLARFTVNAGALAAAVGKVARAAPSRSTIPIIGCVLLAAQPDGTLTACCSDLDKTLTGALAGVDVRHAGAFCVGAALLAGYLGALPSGGTVEIEQGADDVTVRCGRTRAKFATLAPEDFPAFPNARSGDAARSFTLPAIDFGTLLAVGFAASTDGARHYLGGTHVRVDEAAVRAEATDGNRLLRVTVPLPAGAETMPAITIPSEAVALLRWLAPATGTVELTISTTVFTAAFGDGWALRAKLIDGIFPDTDRVMPAPVAAPAAISRTALIEAIRRIALATSGSSVVLDLDGAGLRLSGTRPPEKDRGGAEGEETIDAAYAGQPVRIGFNTRLLAGAVEAFTAAEIALHVTDCASAALFVADDSTLAAVVMPMRV